MSASESLATTSAFFLLRCLFQYLKISTTKHVADRHAMIVIFPEVYAGASVALKAWVPRMFWNFCQSMHDGS